MNNALPAKQALHALIDGLTVWGADRSSSWEQPTDSLSVAREHFYLSRISLDSEPYALRGGSARLAKSETFDLTATVRVYQPGDDLPTCEARWWAIYDAIEAALAVQPNIQLSGAVRQCWITHAETFSEPYEEPGWQVRGEIVVSCQGVNR